MPTDRVYWRIYESRFGGLSANRYTQARLALVNPEGGPSDFGMFYVASDLSGALWEVILRFVEPDESRYVRLDADALVGKCAVRVRLRNKTVPMLDLGQPGLRALFKADSVESVAVAAMLAEPDHERTHPEASELRQALLAHGVQDMPTLAWPSRQHNPSTVYLAYSPPMDETWWETVGEPTELDTAEGHRLIRRELAKCGFTWAPLATTATPEAPSDGE